MMDGEVYPDFVLLWLLCHQSRVEASEARPEECYLEQWSHAAAERGTRALEGLRGGVEEAINSLGSGFLHHRANDELRGKLRSGVLDRQDYYRQLLRLVYRLLFLFVAEDRGLLLNPDAEDAAKDRYTRYYSTRKLRDVAEKRVGARHFDLYRALSLVMEKLGDENGCPELALPALGGFLFDEVAAPDLARAEVSNRDLLDAVRALSLVDYDGSRRPVDYKNLGAEELGSVYESLLELQPELDSASGTFGLKAVSGNERKTTGSYYTPHSLVTSLLDTALDPVLDEAARKPDPEAAILDLKVCDPAVGSGHFLIAAAHRMARRLASVRTGDDEPSPTATREALRDVIGRCLYGVDVNPMAAELCTVSLWMEALLPGRPLSFLDHHIQVGNSLLGATPELISNGIPNEAFKPIEGDDKKLTNAYKKRNREERAAWESGQLSFSLRNLDKNREAIEQGYEEVEEGEESSVVAVREKAARYAALQDSEEMFHARRLADAWCAAFVWPKKEGAPEAITQEVFADLTLNAPAVARETEEEIEQIAERYTFFHWHLAFPNVFDEGEAGGFDVVLGNPPWERIKLQEPEWFAARRPEIATAPNASARKRMIKALVEEDPILHAAFLEDLRKADGESHLIRSSGRFPLYGRGDINTYAVFAETNREIIGPAGRVGCIVPSGIATDNTTKEFFADIAATETLASLYDFENKGIFPNVHSSYKFSLLTLTGVRRPVRAAEFAFFCHAVSDLADPERRFPLTAEDIRLLNPNTRTCPIFRTRRDAEMTKAIYQRVPVFSKEGPLEQNPWGAWISRMLHGSDDSYLFRSPDEFFNEPLRVYESKYFWQFDHRYASVNNGDIRYVDSNSHVSADFIISTQHVVEELELPEKFKSKISEYSLAYRVISNATNERTLVSTVLPRCALINSANNIHNVQGVNACILLANLNAFAIDFLCRQSMGGANLHSYVFQQLAVLSPDAYLQSYLWTSSERTLRDWILPRVLELTYTAWDLEPFARDLGYDGPPFRWDPERRFLIRCELDAAFFHLYGIGRDDTDYIMETFPIVKRKDEAAHGEYRTKRVILEIYDQMARAAETGQPYQTPLDPQPVDLGIRRPATVTPLRPRTEPRPERRDEAPPAVLAAEEKRPFEPHPHPETGDPKRTVAEAPVDAIPESEDFSRLPSEHRGDAASIPAGEARPPDHEPQPRLPGENGDTSAGRAVPEAPNLYQAALALNACLPDGQRVEREALLHDAARDLGHATLTKKVRRALNQALDAEHNAGRLRTDRERVSKPRKK